MHQSATPTNNTPFCIKHGSLVNIQGKEYGGSFSALKKVVGKETEKSLESLPFFVPEVTTLTFWIADLHLLCTLDE